MNYAWSASSNSSRLLTRCCYETVPCRTALPNLELLDIFYALIYPPETDWDEKQPLLCKISHSLHFQFYRAGEQEDSKIT